jgi:threonine dehydrogenase-like Zn-dependent dehydrogenase
MQGIAFLGDRNVELLTFPEPVPGIGEVVLQMKASGICGTDIMLYRRPGDPAQTPVIGGHEPCGIVAELGPGVDATRVKIGDRVMVHHYYGCSTCEHCRSGWAQLCRSAPIAVYGNNRNGGHAPYLVVPAATLIALPDELSFETGAAISCGSGTAYAALRGLNVSGHDTIAIFGQGPVGLAGTQFAKALGARVIALDISPERLARAADFGADVLIDPGTTGDVAAQLLACTAGRGADMALETSGAPAAATAAIKGVRIWGAVCLVAGQGPVDVNVLTDLVFRQITVFGSWTFSAAGQIECARFVAEHGIDVDRLFTHRWQLQDAGSFISKERSDAFSSHVLIARRRRTRAGSDPRLQRRPAGRSAGNRLAHRIRRADRQHVAQIARGARKERQRHRRHFRPAAPIQFPGRRQQSADDGPARQSNHRLEDAGHDRIVGRRHVPRDRTAVRKERSGTILPLTRRRDPERRLFVRRQLLHARRPDDGGALLPRQRYDAHRSASADGCDGPGRRKSI